MADTPIPSESQARDSGRLILPGAILTWLSVWAALRFGVAPPIPGSVMNLYLKAGIDCAKPGHVVSRFGDSGSIPTLREGPTVANDESVRESRRGQLVVLVDLRAQEIAVLKESRALPSERQIGVGPDQPVVLSLEFV